MSESDMFPTPRRHHPMTTHLLTLLDLMSQLDDARVALRLANPEPGALDAAMLTDRARRLVKRAAARLARAQWRAEDEHLRFALGDDAPRPAVGTPEACSRTRAAGG